MRNLLQILNEAAADYQAMINPVLSALRPNERKGAAGIAVDLADEWRKKITDQWDKQVRLAKTLKKADRITWYLRLCRAQIVEIYSAAMDPAKLNKLRQEYLSRSGMSISDDSFSIGTAQYGDSLHDLEHYLSLPIAAIQNYQFRFQPFTTVLKDFQTFEDKWKETVKNTIEDDESKVIIDCGNNWYWVDTEKAYCSKESAAMGHCGNSPRQNTDDHLLSLRKKIAFGGDKVRWEPHLTFILAGDGFLTEMKGKGNEKPAEKYHPMIVTLLKSDYIKGIRGGGYLPENNFSMSDLDEETRDALVAMKPELGSVGDLYDKYGASEEVYARIASDLRSMDLEVYEFDGETAILDHWEDIETYFRRGLRDNDGEKLCDLAADPDLGWLGLSNDEQIVEAIIEGDDDGEADDRREKLANKAGVRPESVVKAIVHMFPKSLGAIWDEVRETVKTEAKDAAEKRVKSISLRCYDISMNIAEDGTVTLTMPVRSLAYNIASYQDHDFDTTDGFEYCVQDGSWLANSDDDYDSYDEPDLESAVDADSIYRDSLDAAFDHLEGLFEDNNQLSFDF